MSNTGIATHAGAPGDVEVMNNSGFNILSGTFVSLPAGGVGIYRGTHQVENGKCFIAKTGPEPIEVPVDGAAGLVAGDIDISNVYDPAAVQTADSDPTAQLAVAAGGGVRLGILERDQVAGQTCINVTFNGRRV